MNPVEIGKAYDQITSLWLSEEFDLSNGIPQHQKAISFVKARGDALDIGCGCTGRFIDLLLKEGFKPEGLDISHEMIALAKVKHPQLKFEHQDICEWKAQNKYDFITAWDSFWHIPLNQQINVLEKIIEAMNVGGVFIFSFGGTHNAEEHTNCFMGPFVYSATLGVNGYLSFFSKMNCFVRHLEFDQLPGEHAYFIVQKN